MADYFAVSLLMTYHQVAADRCEAAVKAISAGLDLELPALDCFGEPLKTAVATGKLPMSTIDTAVRRVLTTKMRLGLFESPYADLDRVRAVFTDQASRRLSRRAAVSGIVLLANEGILPISAQVSTLAVIGPGADDRRLLQGDYHYPAHQEMFLESKGTRALEVPPLVDAHKRVGTASEVAPTQSGNGSGNAGSDPFYFPIARGTLEPGQYYTEHVTPLAGLTAALTPDVEVLYEKGCELSGCDRSGFPAAVAAATQADLAVVVLGGRSGLDKSSTVGEARDATDLRLTGLQEQLLIAVAATGTPTVLVVMSGRVHVLSDVIDHVRALLVAWPLGEQGGAALADVLLGRCEPTGRLPVTLPRATGQIPLHSGHRSRGARSEFYGDYTDCARTPLFSFGHGLGYTTFAYSDLTVDATGTSSPATVGVTVTNTGAREGDEVVQLYVSDLVASVSRPRAFLIGFARAHLGPDGEARVTFVVHPSRLAFYDEAMRFVVEPGLFRFSVGASSVDIRQHATVDITGPVTPFSQRSVVAVAATVTYKAAGVRVPK